MERGCSKGPDSVTISSRSAIGNSYALHCAFTAAITQKIKGARADSNLAVVDEHPVAELLGDAVGGPRVERGGFLLGDLLHLTV